MNPPRQFTLALPNPLAARKVQLVSTDGHHSTTRRTVAERFGKRHDDALKAINHVWEIDATSLCVLYMNACTVGAQA